MMGGKKIKGRKKHIATDTCGHLLTVKVHAANIHDTMSGCHVFRAAQNKYPTIQGGCGDEGYRGTFVDFCAANGIKIDISKKIKDGWRVLAKRWCVERTFAWANNSRRLSKDYEISVSSAENFFYVSHSHTLLKRLC